ncbi:hypothetical protein GLOIN_2v1838532 [Rhizophagus irregularis DAOM 181602=DAOM 197198]|nr:hypothetical protein GLOIN_2v1838532 [Rhizophagus irregularis DAOM 181602=DAOM 197198]
MDEYYPGYEALSSYLKKFDNPSYRNFLDLNREEVIKSPPFTENWGGLESAWSNRFIRAVQTHIPDRFEDIKLKVEAECRNRGLKLYWDEILREREKNNVREIHITGSLKLLGASGRRNIQELLTDGTILPKQDMDDLPKPELLHRDVPQVEEGVNDVEDENQVDTSEESEEDRPKINKTAFHEAHKSIPDSSKMRLSTGKIVEDVLFDFCRNMDYEHHAHSYIIDCDDAEIKSLYTETEWKELIKDRLGLPINPAHIAKELSKYAKKTLRELRQIVMTPYLQDDIEYDAQQHYDMEWIQTSLRTLTNLYENTDHPLARRTDIKRTDAPSLASANRKNRAKLTNERKFTGRKIDGIIYIIDRLLEVGAIEAARCFMGDVNYEEKKVNELQVFGILHLGLRVQATRLWRAGGSITVFYKDPQVYYINNKFSVEGVKNFLKFLAMINRHKIIMMNNLNIIRGIQENNANPESEETSFLDELTGVVHLSQPPTPPSLIQFFADNEKTPKKAKSEKSSLNLNLDDNSQIKKENEILKVEVSRINDSLEKYKLIADNQLKDFKNKLKEKDEKYQFLRM